MRTHSNYKLIVIIICLANVTSAQHCSMTEIFSQPGQSQFGDIGLAFDIDSSRIVSLIKTGENEQLLVVNLLTDSTWTTETIVSDSLYLNTGSGYNLRRYNVAIDNDRIVVTTANRNRCFVYDWNGNEWEETIIEYPESITSNHIDTKIALNKDVFILHNILVAEGTSNQHGIIYICEYDGQNWQIQKRTNGRWSFGGACAINDSFIVISESAHFSYRGAVHIYENTGLTSMKIDHLFPTYGVAYGYGAQYGSVVGLDDNYLAVGAYGQRRLYIYKLQNLNETPKIYEKIQSEPYPRSLDMSNGRIVVGRYGESSYVYTKLTYWNQRQIDLGPKTLNAYGAAVAISGDRVAILNTGNTQSSVPESIHLSRWNNAQMAYDTEIHRPGYDCCIEHMSGGISGNKVFFVDRIYDGNTNIDYAVVIYELLDDDYFCIDTIYPSDTFTQFTPKLQVISDTRFIIKSGLNYHHYLWNGTDWQESIVFADYQSYYYGDFYADNMNLIFANNDTVFVHEWDGATYHEVQRIINPDQEINDRFGWTFALDDSILLISALFDQDFGVKSGSVHRYIKRNTGFEYVEQLNAFDAKKNQQFGYDMDLNGQRIVISAPFRTNNNGLYDAGNVYVFEGDSANWSQTIIKASDLEIRDHFGNFLDMEGDKLVVLSPGQDYNSSKPLKSYLYEWDSSGNRTEKILPNPRNTIGRQYYSMTCQIDNNRILYGHDVNYLLQCCTDNIVVTRDPILDGTYSANLTVQSNKVIPSGEQVKFSALNEISLRPDFQVDLGAIFEAVMDGCVE